MRWFPTHLALVAIALCAACKDKSESESSSPPAVVDGLGAVPARVQTVIAADVETLADSQLVRRAVSEMLARDPDLRRRAQDLLASCKLVPGEDVSGMILAMGETRERSLLVAQGRFDEAALAGCVGKSMSGSGGELTRDVIDGRTVYSARGTATEAPVHFALGSPRTLVVSSSPAMLAESLGAGDKLAANRRMSELLGRADKELPLWGVGLVPADVGAGLVGVAGVQKPPQAMVLNLDLRDGLDLALEVEMVDESDASAAVSLAVPQLAAASLVAQKEGLGQVVNKIQVDARERWVRLSLEVGAAELAEILARVQRTVDTPGGDQQNPPPTGDPGAESGGPDSTPDQRDQQDQEVQPAQPDENQE